MEKQSNTLERVLLVSQYPEVHRGITSFLSKNNVQIIEKKDEAQALELLTEIKTNNDLKPDLVLADSTFPNVSLVCLYFTERDIPCKIINTQPYIKSNYSIGQSIKNLKEEYSNLTDS